MDPEDASPPPTAPSTLPAPPPSHPMPQWGGVGLVGFEVTGHDYRRLAADPEARRLLNLDAAELDEE